MYELEKRSEANISEQNLAFARRSPGDSGSYRNISRFIGMRSGGHAETM